MERSGRVSGELCFGRARIGRLCGGCRVVDSGAGLALRFALNDRSSIVAMTKKLEKGVCFPKIDPLAFSHGEI